jgi:hypothetical protein
MNIKNKFFDFRIILGTLLILGGLLGIFEKLNVITNATGIFWALIFGVAGFVFFYSFITNKQHWWSAIPAFSLLGLAGSIVLPDALNYLGGLSFLGGIGFGFFAIFISDKKHWWAIIPGGILLTLGSISVISNFVQDQGTGAAFFVGLGFTFLLVGILPTGSQRMNWAFIPATILLIIGALLGISFKSTLDYVWIFALFFGGIVMIWQFLISQSNK